MRVATHAAVSFSFSFVFTRNLYNTHYIKYVMAHSFLVPPIVEGGLLTCQILDQGSASNAIFTRRQVLINRRQMPDIRGKSEIVHASDNCAV